MSTFQEWKYEDTINNTNSTKYDGYLPYQASEGYARVKINNAKRYIDKERGDTPLSKEFFSGKNIDYLHEAIKDQVNALLFNVTGDTKFKLVAKQNESELLDVMGNYYMDLQTWDFDNVQVDLDRLNKQVVIYSANSIISTINKQLKYIKSQDVKSIEFPRVEFSASTGNNIIDLGSQMM